MDLVHWCLMIMGILPIVCAGISKAGARNYDNRNPREWLAAQEGYRKRAVAAQQNSWEAFAYFTAAMVVATATQANLDGLENLTVYVVLARVAYIVCYVADWHLARTLCWTVGFAVTTAIFFAGPPL
jgi:uncharacterized MAPEG superfamily protein